jgi:hypothetical protein
MLSPRTTRWSNFSPDAANENERIFFACFGHWLIRRINEASGFRKGRSGREFQVKRFGRWLVTFWPDDPVLELRVVDIKQIVP